MKKAIHLVIEKLGKQPISSLSRKELRTYFDYRLKNLLSEKRVLVRNELEYLFCETGPGNRRLDPEILSFLTNEKIFIFSGFEHTLKTLLNQKKEIEKYITQNCNSPEVQKLLTRLLKAYLDKLKVVSTKPFILEGFLGNVPVACLIQNNGWILPDKELFTFLSKYHKERRFPILIAKKISGILFPVFKGLFILGLNTYKIYLPKDAKILIDKATSNEPLLANLKYHNQFQFIDKNFSKECVEDYHQGDPIKNFFETILKNNISNYYENYLQSKIEIKDNFIDTVSQFKKNRANKALLKSYQTRATLIQDLAST